MKNIKHILWAFVAVVVLHSCTPADGNHPGMEYMPDMGHSIAQEANVYTDYYYNTWDSASVVKLKELPIAGLPAKGAIPRGYAGAYLAANQEGGASAQAVMAYMNGEDQVQGISVPVNGAVPYYYEDTDADRDRATAELIDNPFPITAEGLEKGEELYNTFCGICHGEKGDGVGYLVSDDNANAAYPAAPANFLLDQFLEASNGRYYHAIMYGKNVMGGYADKISYEERWQVIHWIRALQAKEKKLEYNAEVNSLNPTFGTPESEVPAIAQSMEDDAEAPAEADGHHEDGDHGHDDGHEDDHHDDHGHGDGGHGKK